MSSFTASSTPGSVWRRRLAVALGGLLVGTLFPAGAASAATGNRIDLKVLVLSDGGPATSAIATQLDREGVPYTTVNLSAGRATINSAFLEDAANHVARYQAVVLPNQTGTGTASLTAAELTALATYEKTYGIRQVDAYVYPGATVGTQVPSFSGTLDGAAATVTAAGLSGPFGYLKGSLKIDDIDPAVVESYGYLATGATGLPAGETYTPLINATAGTASGSIAGVYTHDSREELAISVAYNSAQAWWNELAHGVVTWMTRGVHLGYHRNYLGVHVDDIFLPDSRWSAAGKCTPGDGCVDPNVTTTDIRMTAADVAKLVAWQNANGLKLDMVYNAAGSEAAATAAGGTDALTTALLASANQFQWINHTYSHTFLGCIQIAPTVVGGTWHCAAPGETGPYYDAELVPTFETTSGNIRWLSQAKLESEIKDNQAWATSHNLPNYDPSVLVTGEHSGLLTLPQQTIDNPFLAAAFTAAGIKVTASDASRETTSRTIGSTVTVPRYPMNIFYNAGTYLDEVSEYNWIYTATANGGSGICTANPATSTCITPLAASDNATAKASFDSYIKPIEIRNAYAKVVANDPRPFYAHQSNLAEDGILYPVLEGILARYKSVIDTAKSPVLQPAYAGLATALNQMSAWKAAQPSVTGYIDAAGVHLSGAAGTKVPLTVPSNATAAGTSAYDNELSGWLTSSATDTVVATSPVAMFGYVAPLTAPLAPTATATAGDASATVTWTVPANGGSPITGYTVKVYSGTTTTVVKTLTAAATATSLAVTGLTNGTGYSFDVAAVNAIGTGAASARTAVVTPAAVTPTPTPTPSTTPTPTPTPTGTSGSSGGGSVIVIKDPGTGGRAITSPTAPLLGAVTKGVASARVTWTAPKGDGGAPIHGYQVRVYSRLGAMVKTLAAPAAARGLTVTGLARGGVYRFDVVAVNEVGPSEASARSATVVIPTLPAAPRMGRAASGAVGGPVSATATWLAPLSDGGMPITKYVLTAQQLSASGKVVRTVSVAVHPRFRSFGMRLPAKGVYRFSIKAVTAVGTSPASLFSNRVAAR